MLAVLDRVLVAGGPLLFNLSLRVVSWFTLGSAVSAVFIAYSNEYGFAFAPDEYIFFFVYDDAGFSEDRDGVAVRSFPYTH